MRHLFNNSWFVSIVSGFIVWAVTERFKNKLSSQKVTRIREKYSFDFRSMPKYMFTIYMIVAVIVAKTEGNDTLLEYLLQISAFAVLIFVVETIYKLKERKK